MVKQLIVVFLMLVVLTQESFSASYQPSNPEQTESPGENQDVVNENTTIEGEQGGSQQSNQTQEDNNVADQNKTMEAGGAKQDSQEPDRIHPTGWGYGEEEDTGIQPPGTANGRDRNENTTKNSEEQDSQKSDIIYFPDDSEDEEAGFQNQGQGYGQYQNGDTTTDKKGDGSQQSYETEEENSNGNATSSEKGDNTQGSDNTQQESGGGNATNSGTNDNTQQSGGADEANGVYEQSNNYSQDQDKYTAIDWNEVYEQWPDTNEFIQSIYGQSQNEPQDSVEDTETSEKNEDSQQSDGNEEENGGGYATPSGKGDDTQQADDTQQENGDGDAATSGTNDNTQQSGGADEADGVDDQSSQDQNEDATEDWDKIYEQWSGTNKLIRSIYGQNQEELQDSVEDTETSEKNEDSQRSDETKEENGGGDAATSGTSDDTQQSDGADEENGIGGYSSNYDQGQDEDTTRVEGLGDSEFPDETQLSSYGQGQSEQQDATGDQGSENSQDADQESSGIEDQNNAEPDNSSGDQVNATNRNETTDQQGYDGDIVEVSVQTIRKEISIGAKNIEAATGRKETLILQSDGQNVTLQFSSTEFAIVFFDNVFLLENTELVTINGIFSEMANQLKASGTKNVYHVIPAS